MSATSQARLNGVLGQMSMYDTFLECELLLNISVALYIWTLYVLLCTTEKRIGVTSLNTWGLAFTR